MVQVFEPQFVRRHGSAMQFPFAGSQAWPSPQFTPAQTSTLHEETHWLSSQTWPAAHIPPQAAIVHDPFTQLCPVWQVTPMQGSTTH